MARWTMAAWQTAVASRWHESSKNGASHQVAGALRIVRGDRRGRLLFLTWRECSFFRLHHLFATAQGPISPAPEANVERSSGTGYLK